MLKSLIKDRINKLFYDFFQDEFSASLLRALDMNLKVFYVGNNVLGATVLAENVAALRLGVHFCNGEFIETNRALFSFP
jgi:hypothetical protein